MEHDYTTTERRKTPTHICTKETQIDDIYEDINLVKNDINTIKSDKVHTNELLTNIQSQIIKLEKRLYVDNGTPSIQTILKTGENRMANIENIMKTNLDSTNKKIAEVEAMPANYAKYTIGIISLLGILCGLIIWIANHP